MGSARATTECRLQGGAHDESRAVTSRRQLVAALEHAAPPGLLLLDSAMRARLARITAELVANDPDALSSAERFQSQRDRSLGLDERLLRAGLEGRVVLVTGGTGCIGSALLRELHGLQPRRLVSLSRSPTAPAGHVDSVEYLHADITDEVALRRAFRRAAPDVVFHLAAQRDPGLAERAVPETLDTNIFGTRNVLSASLDARVERLVYASTGKALRPFTPHVYAASKKFGELLALAAARDGGMRVGVVRFTHVVDNSLVLTRFRCVRGGDVLRVHDAWTQFYTQSAREAAQLLLWGIVNAQPRGAVDVSAIRDLGLPTDLLDLALAVASEGSQLRPIYVAGYEPGYEDSYYPGLYDPETAADVSPLLNAFEAARARDAGNVGIDASSMQVPDRARIVDMLKPLDPAFRRRAQASYLRAELNAVSLALFEAALESSAPDLIRRLVRLTAPWRGQMSETDLAIDDCLRRREQSALPLVDC
jgi:nucleoside-diphosphate-sugar epimerase